MILYLFKTLMYQELCPRIAEMHLHIEIIIIE